MRWVWGSLWLVVVVGACFDPSETECSEGSEGCACVELQCEVGLACQSGVCVAAAVGTGTDATGPSATVGSVSGSTQTSGSGSTTVAESSAATGPATTTTGATDPASTSGAPTPGTGTTGVNLCGNGVLDRDEECDGTNACTDCELENWGCNPLNNVPCADGLKCTLEFSAIVPPRAICLAFLEPPPGRLHEGNCFGAGDVQDEWCGLGLKCVTSQSANACDVNCCVEHCDLNDAAFACAGAGDGCLPTFDGTEPPGLEYLGFCGG